MRPSIAPGPRASLALRLGAVCLAGAAFIATSPPDWTDSVTWSFAPVQLNAERPFVLVRVQGSVADGFGAPDLQIGVHGEEATEGCPVRIHLLDEPWDGVLDEAGLPVLPETAELIAEATLVGEMGTGGWAAAYPNDTDAFFMISTNGACDLEGTVYAGASKGAKQRSDDPEVQAEAELLAPQATVDEATKTRMPS